MKKLYKVLLAAGFSLIAATAMAVEPKQGGYEAGIQATGWFFGEDIENVFGPSANVLAYYTDALAVGARAEVGFASDTVYSILGEVQYSLPKTNELKPYIGALVGPCFVSADGDSDTLMKFGGTLGVKSYVSKEAAFFGEFQMGYISGSVGTSYFGVGVGGLFKL